MAVTGELLYKAGQAERNKIGYQLALQCQMDSDADNFYEANRFQDFKEFLSDHYLAGGIVEFKECWEQFLQWNQDNQS